MKAKLDHASTRFLLVALCSTILGFGAHAQESDRRLLLPLKVSVPGAFGAQFSTHLTVFNRGETPVQLRGIDTLCPLSPCIEPDGAAATINPRHAISEFMDRGTPGLFVSHAANAQLDFNLRARDSSQDPFSFGTAIPIVDVEQFRGHAFNLLGIQSTGNFRAMVRVYGKTTSTVVIRAVRQANELVLDEWHLSLSVPAHEHQPAYAQLSLPDWGVSFVRLEVAPESASLPVWAFVSVTNNITQQFTLVTPR